MFTQGLRDDIATRIRRRLGRPVRVTFHDNRRVMLSFRSLKGGGLSIRLHHMFLSATPLEIGAISRYVRTKDAAARRVIERHIQRYIHLIGVRLPPEAAPGRGRVYDLDAIYRSLNRRFFRNRVRARILWGKRVRRERKRTIRLGYYCDTDKKIVINPALDRRNVPRYVVEWIVFHEMLHHVIGWEERNGMLIAHTREFRRREQAFPLYAKAADWEARNVDMLLRA